MGQWIKYKDRGPVNLELAPYVIKGRTGVTQGDPKTPYAIDFGEMTWVFSDKEERDRVFDSIVMDVLRYPEVSYADLS